MNDLNLPPFYVGQPIVCINPSAILIKGHKYFCKDIKLGCCGWEVYVGLSESNELQSNCIWIDHCKRCGKVERTFDSRRFHFADRFAPIQENFQSISLEKVLEKETPLISVN